jgi:DNA gyrase subunit B
MRDGEWVSIEAREIIRRRPGMYVGDTQDGSGRLQLLWEVVANAFDEHLAGHCDLIEIRIEDDGAFTVEDNGRGLRVDLVDGVPFAQRAMTELHAGPTLDGHAPHEHLGLYGAGLCVVAALSERLTLDVFRDGRHYSQDYFRGAPVASLSDIGPSDRRGTRLGFLPDPLVFGNLPIMADVIAARLHELACLFPRLSFRFRDLRDRHFHSPDGLLALLRALLLGRGESLGDDPFHCEDVVEGVRVEVIADWCGERACIIESFANVLRTTEGGTHVAGLLSGLTKGAMDAMPDVASGRSAGAMEVVVSTGLRALVCVRLDDPCYAAPTRDRLSSPRVAEAVSACVASSFRGYLATRPTLTRRFETGLL